MKLQGKIMNFLGDSITEGVGVADREHNRYDRRLLRQYDLAAVNNYGISGTRLAHQASPSDFPRFDLCFCGRMYDMDPRADIIVVYGGVNDYFHGDAPIGTAADRTPATFWGSVDFLMRNLPAVYPKATVVFLTPAHEYFENTPETLPSPRPNKRPDALPLLEYVNIIKAKGREWNIPVLDLFEQLGIDPNLPSHREQYTADGLHFNDAGHERLAACLGAFLSEL